MALLTVKRKAYARKSYIRKDGTRVSASKVGGSTFKVKDVGALGRTPKSKQWFEPKVHTGWSKDLSQKARIAKSVKAHKGDLLAAARSLIALHNVTTDPTTRRLAKSDADILRKYAKEGEGYKTVIEARSGATCVDCGRKIPYGHKATGVRRGLGFYYSHPGCYKK